MGPPENVSIKVEIRRIAAEVEANRPERDYQATFRRALSRVHNFLRWENGEVVERDDHLFYQLSEQGLRPEHVELLRKVFAALPRPLFTVDGEDTPSPIDIADGPCPLCGSRGEAEGERATPHKDRKAAREEIANAARKKIAHEGFMAWVNARLTDEDKLGVWSLPRQLYEDYATWTHTQRQGQTQDGYAEQKAAVMTDTAWGKLMGLTYNKRRDGKKGAWYNVRLKKRKQVA